MKIAITGGTGLVGTALTNLLIKEGHKVFVLTRSPKRHEEKKNIEYIKWLSKDSTPEKELADIDAFVNLAGESINSGRWNEERKQRILNSRLNATNEVINLITKMDKKPSVLVNASAIGYYGTSETETYTEQSTQKGTDFLATVVQKWEKEAEKANDLGVRTAYARFGIILDENEGALPKIALPYKMFAGGTVGSGKQWLSWVHIQDVARAILFAIETDNVKGPFNVTAPNPVMMKEFGKTLASVLNRPHWIPAPSFALKLALGEMSILVLEGQRVLPTVLEENGFSFKYSDLSSALKNIYK